MAKPDFVQVKYCSKFSSESRLQRLLGSVVRYFAIFCDIIFIVKQQAYKTCKLNYV